MSERKKILITEDVAGAGIDDLKTRFHVEADPDLWKKISALRAAVKSVDGLIVRNQTRVDAELISCAGALKVIGRAGAGYDNIDVNAASRTGVVVVFSPEENAVSVAEHVFGLLLSLTRKIPPGGRLSKGWCLGEEKISWR